MEWNVLSFSPAVKAAGNGMRREWEGAWTVYAWMFKLPLPLLYQWLVSVYFTPFQTLSNLFVTLILSPSQKHNPCFEFFAHCWEYFPFPINLQTPVTESVFESQSVQLPDPYSHTGTALTYYSHWSVERSCSNTRVWRKRFMGAYEAVNCILLLCYICSLWNIMASIVLRVFWYYKRLLHLSI